MTDANPYELTKTISDQQRSAIPGRFAVLAIHFALLFGVLVGGPALSAFISAQPGSGTLETELSGLDDILRAFTNYSFVPVMLVILLDLPVYLLIRYLKGRSTRWIWLRWTTALIPVAIALYLSLIHISEPTRPY